MRPKPQARRRGVMLSDPNFILYRTIAVARIEFFISSSRWPYKMGRMYVRPSVHPSVSNCVFFCLLPSYVADWVETLQIDTRRWRAQSLISWFCDFLPEGAHFLGHLYWDDLMKPVEMTARPSERTVRSQWNSTEPPVLPFTMKLNGATCSIVEWIEVDGTNRSISFSRSSKVEIRVVKFDNFLPHVVRYLKCY